MKLITYILLMVFTAGLCACGGGGGEEENPPVPAPTKFQVAFALKSGITGIQDAGLGSVVQHIRLYLYDGNKKLLSVNKYKSVGELKALELDKGDYSIVLVGNVENDGNISTEAVGTPMNEMFVRLTKKEGSEYYAPIGDVLCAKGAFTVTDKEINVDLVVNRTLSSTKLGMTDYSGKVSNVGVLVPGVATAMGFGDSKWSNPGTVFVQMTETKAQRAQMQVRAEPESKNYNVSVNISVVKEQGSNEPKIQCNIVATDNTGKVVVAQVLDVPVETKPNVEIALGVSVQVGDDGKVQVSVSDVEVKNENGDKEEIKKEDIEVKETDVSIDPMPGDWETGGDESVEMGDKEGTVRPGGGTGEWEEGDDESVEIGDSK